MIAMKKYEYGNCALLFLMVLTVVLIGLLP